MIIAMPSIEMVLVFMAAALALNLSLARASERRIAMLQRMTGALFVALGARLAVANK